MRIKIEVTYDDETTEGIDVNMGPEGDGGRATIKQFMSEIRARLAAAKAEAQKAGES
jgi:hypothetical protein